MHPPKITFRDFEKVLLRARPTVSAKDLDIYEQFTKGAPALRCAALGTAGLGWAGLGWVLGCMQY